MQSSIADLKSVFSPPTVLEDSSWTVKCGTYIFLLFSDRPKSNSDPCRYDGYYHARIDKWVGPSEAEVTWCGAKSEKSTEPGVGETHYGFRWVVCKDQNPLVHDKCGDRLTVGEINRGSYVTLASLRPRKRRASPCFASTSTTCI